MSVPARVGVALFPTAYRFRAGHRLRVQVAGGAFPRSARDLGTADSCPSAVEGRACRFEGFADPTHPSRVELPVLG